MRVIYYLKNPIKLIDRIKPTTLFNRSLLILITPLILAQFFLGYFFFDRHTDTILRQLSSTIAGDVALIVKWVKEDKNHEQISIDSSSFLKLNVKFTDTKDLDKKGAHKESWLYDYLAHALDQHLSIPYYFKFSQDEIFILIKIANQNIIEISLPKKRFFAKTTFLVIIWSLISSLILFAIAFIFFKNQIKPLKKLAISANLMSKGDYLEKIPIEGAYEIRALSKTLNTMRARVQKHLHERTQMLAGVSHDLRTPITRMQLELALMKKNPHKEGLLQDLKQMQRMIDGFLEYAKGTISESRKPIPIASFLQQAIDNFPFKQLKIVFNPTDNPVVLIKTEQFIRCINNLLLNCDKHATNALLTLQVSDDFVETILEDNGPGIEKTERDRVFIPFYKQDNARNLNQNVNSAGFGLGLSIVRDIIRAHGGKIKLDNSKNLGGLKVILTFPKI